MNFQAAVILGVRVLAVDKQELVEQVLEWVKYGNYCTITYVNAHCLNLAVENPS